MNPNLQALIDQVTMTEGILDSAVVFVQGVPALITAAVAEATKNGATEAQLAPLSDLATQLKDKSDALAAAMASKP